jgi:hypothetical protein
MFNRHVCIFVSINGMQYFTLIETATQTIASAIFIVIVALFATL